MTAKIEEGVQLMALLQRGDHKAIQKHMQTGHAAKGESGVKTKKRGNSSRKGE
jgi:hypothetical protein